jgi:GT2 family glycosyltransferase
VVVLDNASADGSAEAIAAEFPQVRLIASKENLGFARGNNVAAREAGGEYLLLLNPDTVVLDGAIEKAWRFARENPAAGIVGGRTYFEDGTLNYSSCHGTPTPWSVLCMGLGLSAVFRRSAVLNPESLGAWKRDTVREVPAVTGCFFLLKRSLWESLSGFDESFFMYAEETDLCLRARKLGHKCMICPDAKLIHYGGASEKVRSEKMIRLFRAKHQLLRKHWSRPAARYGLAMLDLWAGSRMAALSLLRRVRPKYQAGYEAWREIWQRRGEYRVVEGERA